MPLPHFEEDRKPKGFVHVTILRDPFASANKPIQVQPMIEPLPTHPDGFLAYPRVKDSPPQQVWQHFLPTPTVIRYQDRAAVGYCSNSRFVRVLNNPQSIGWMR